MSLIEYFYFFETILCWKRFDFFIFQQYSHSTQLFILSTKNQWVTNLVLITFSINTLIVYQYYLKELLQASKSVTIMLLKINSLPFPCLPTQLLVTKLYHSIHRKMITKSCGTWLIELI